MKKRGYRGMTMIELLVAIAIVGVIATLAFPMFGGFINDGRLKAASETLYHDLLKARSHAIKTQANVTVVFQGGTNWCYGMTTASSCNCLVANNCPLGQKTYVDFDDTTLTLTTITSSTVFDGIRGLASITGTMAYSTPDGDAVSVVLNKLGQSNICSNNLSEYPGC